MREGEYQSYFDNIQQELADELRQARHIILVVVIWFTNYILLGILEDKARKSVFVQLVILPHDFCLRGWCLSRHPASVTQM